MDLIYIFRIHEADVTHTDTKMRDGVGLGAGCWSRRRV